MKTAFALSILAVAACLCALLLTIRSTVAAIPNELAATRAALIQQVAMLRMDAIAEIDAQATATRIMIANKIYIMTGVANKQLTGIRSDLQTDLQQTTASFQASVQAALEPINGIRLDLQPVLSNAAALEKDAHDSLDDLYPDIRALVESSDVAATQTAQTMQTVREAAPAITTATVSVGKSAASIAETVDKEATKLTQPQTRRQKLMGWLELMSKLGLRIL